MGGLFNFVADLAIIAMALVGFMLTMSVFLRWLEDGRPATIASVATNAEAEIDRIQGDIISQMFDSARRARMERTIGEQQ